jgi:hypothetical protein
MSYDNQPDFLFSLHIPGLEPVESPDTLPRPPKTLAMSSLNAANAARRAQLNRTDA